MMLTGRNVVVVGGRGHVGRILVDGLLAAGAGVIAVTRSPGAWSHPASGPCAMVVPARSSGPAAGGADAVRESGMPVHAVVASLGGWTLEEQLLDLPPERWRATLESHLTAHLLAAQEYVPLLAAGSRSPYLMLNGAASRRPMADAGSISVAGAGQAMLLQTLRAQPGERRARFHEVVLMEAVSGDPRNLDPQAQIGPQQVVDAVTAVLNDPDAPTSTLVKGSPSGV